MAGSHGAPAALRRRLVPTLGAATALLAFVVVSGSSPAALLRGTKGGERIVGTKGADTIRGKGGNDRIKGWSGRDNLAGGSGRDKVKGGRGRDKVKGGRGRDKVVGQRGADSIAGGAGNDVIKAADGRRDRAINGGGGVNRCVIDVELELSIVRNCGSIAATPGGGSGPGPGAGAGLRVLGADGVLCDTPLPLCVFTLSGDGADAPLGTVTGGGGVTALGGSVSITGTEWTAAGLYGCTSDGFLRVTIGSESVDVPVDCAA